MSSTYGENLKLSIFGQSHGPAIGMVLDGIPAGLSVDEEELQLFLSRRAPGQSDWSTPRRESDCPEFLGGILDGYTCGAPIAAVIPNKNTRSGDYANLMDCPRPGHADYTAHVKYGGFQDAAGGGHFSGRLTAPICIAGGLCKQWLEDMNIRIAARIVSIGEEADSFPLDCLNPQIDQIRQDFPVFTEDAALRMQHRISQARASADSVGGMIECCIIGIPAGVGEPMFGGVESRIAQIIYGIPAVKSLEFGAGSAAAQMPGSLCNDPFTIENGEIRTLSNHSGGIQGGITNGMPVIFRCTFKPTPSIPMPQQSISLSRSEITELQIKGRHDP